MALGEALMEEQTFRDGLLESTSLFDYKTPTVLEMPEVHTYLIETIDPEGPFGAKEAGQGPLLPVIPAVANALYDAVGVRIDEVPITPDKVLRALDLAAKGKLGRVGPKGMPAFDFPAADPRRAPGRGPAVMRLPPFTYLRPRELGEACALLAEHGTEAALVAGGTDLLPKLKRQQIVPTRARRAARGSTSCAGSGANGGLSIGAGARLVRARRAPGARGPVRGARSSRRD